MCSDFLPPWLRDADDREPKKSPPPPPPPSSDPQEDEPALPPWMVMDIDRQRQFVKETGELSEDFLAAADELPDSLPASVTYDQWQRIQYEKTRERSLDEEVPDLLQDIPDLSAPPGGANKLPDTGELPDWFLGLEELDEEEAPDWYVQSQSPPAPPPPPFVVDTPDAPDAPQNVLDDFFAGISSQRSTTGRRITTDALSSLMEPDPNDTESYTLDAAFGTGDADSSGEEAEDVPNDPQVYDDFGEFPRLNTAQLNAAFAEFTDVDISSSSTPGASTLGGDDFTSSALREADAGYVFDDFAPTDAPGTPPSQADVTMPSRSLLSKLTQRAAQNQAFTPSEPEPESITTSADDLSWLNEINAIVGAAVGGHDEHRGTSVPPIMTDMLDANPSAIDEGDPDWLFDLEDARPPTGALQTADLPKKTPIDFSGLDFNFGVGEARTDSAETQQETYADLFTDLGSKSNPNTSETDASFVTAVLDSDVPFLDFGKTVVLEDYSAEPPAEVPPPVAPPPPPQRREPRSPVPQRAKAPAPPPAVQSGAVDPSSEIAIPPVSQEQRQSGFVGIVIPPPDNPSVADLIPLPPVPTIYTSTLIPFDTTPVEPKASPKAKPKPAATDGAEGPLALESLASEGAPEPALRLDEDMSWLQTVRFDDPLAQPQAADAVETPVFDASGEAHSEDMGDLFAALQVPEEVAVEPTTVDDELADFYNQTQQLQDLDDPAPSLQAEPHDYDVWSSETGETMTEESIAETAEDDWAATADAGWSDDFSPGETTELDADAALAALFGDLTADSIGAEPQDLPPAVLSQPREVATWVMPSADAEEDAFQDSDASLQAFGTTPETLEDDDTQNEDAFARLFSNMHDAPQEEDLPPSFPADTLELNALLGTRTFEDDDTQEIEDFGFLQEADGRPATDASGFDVAADIPADAGLDDAFSAMFGDLGASAQAEQPQQDLPPAFAANTGELSALFDTGSLAFDAGQQAQPEPYTDVSGFDFPADIPADAGLDDAFSAMFGELAQAEQPQQDLPPAFAANTGELSALFDTGSLAFDAGEELPDFDFAQTPESEPGLSPDDAFAALFHELPTDPVPLSQGDPSMSATGLLSHIGQPLPKAEETFMPPKDDFDSLFDDMDDLESSRQESESLPSTGMLSGADEDMEVVSPSDADLDALFAAYEDEQLGAGTNSGGEDDFLSSLGLGDLPDEPPPDPGSPGRRGSEGFSPPEMSNTTDISGEDTPSLWEDEHEDFVVDDLPKVPAFDHDTAVLDDLPAAAENPLSDWDWNEEQAVSPFSSDWDQPPPPAAEPASVPVPDWLSEIDVIDETLPVPPNAMPKAAPADLESYLADLDTPEPLLTGATPFSEPLATTDGLDYDKLFTDELPAFVDPDQPAPSGETLETANLLGDLGAAVGVVSAGAIARQMSDRPESELSDRLQQLRKRATDELKVVADETPQDDMAQVLPGVANVIAPAPFIVEPQNLSDGIVLSTTQQQHAALLRGLVGLPLDAPAARPRKASAIDQTYAAPRAGEGADEFTFEEPISARIEPEVVIPKSSYRAKRTYRIDRLLISVLLAAGIALPFFIPQLRLGDLPPPAFAANSRERAAFVQVNRLDPFDLVLVSLDYSPGAAAELDTITSALTRHLLLQGARPIFISSNPFALLRAETLMNGLNADADFLERLGISTRDPLRRNSDYYIARFLPGNAVGLRAFGEDIGGLLTTDLNGQTSGLNIESLRNLALIILISDRADNLRAYAEQIAPLTNRPFVAAVNYASAPLAEPYAASDVVDGLLVGYGDGLTYASLVAGAEGVERGERPLAIENIISTPADQPTAAPGDAVPSEATPAPGETPAAEATPAAPGEPAAETTPQVQTASPTGLTATVISADGANVRTGPGTDFTRIAGAGRNAVLVVLGLSEDGDWVNVRLEDGTEGWVSAGLVIINEAEPAAPTATPAASGMGAPALLRQTTAAEPLDPESPDALRWYAMNFGIILIALIITLGAVVGILGSLFRRKARS